MRRPATLPTLLLLFVGSGCSALIYEVVWLQLLQLVIGSTAVSLAVLLGTFMGGMCLGSLLLPRLLPTRVHPLRAYAALELGIGLLGIVVYLLVPPLGRLYASLGGGGPLGISLRAVIAGLCLLPPTVLMGATLPAIARWVDGSSDALSKLGLFYAGNIAGAVFGALLAGFYLLRVHDMLVATVVAAAINVGVSGVAGALARRASEAARPAQKARGAAHLERAGGPGAIHLAIALSGACALGAEVVWTRLLSLLLGGTTYTFSIILAVFLAGLGIGSAAGAALVRRAVDPRLALGLAQLGIALAVAWAAYTLTRSLPSWPMVPWLAASPWPTFAVDLPRSALAMLPATLLWGASFPLALAAAGSTDDAARLVGRLYAANTFGAIAGATLFGLVVIPAIGTRTGQQLLIALAAAAAVLTLAPRARSARPAAAVAFAAGLALAAVLAWRVPGVPPEVIGYGRFLPLMKDRLPEFLYAGEGRNASIAVSVFPDGKLNFHVSGKVEASTDLEDMRLQRMLGHLAALAHPAPRSVLIVGFGSGVTAGSFVVHPEVERIVIVEIEPLIPRVVGRWFERPNLFVLDDPRVEIVHDDARHFLLTTDETFDVITSDPIHPWVKGSAALYTREYFELVKQRLRPGGVVTQWVPLYESSADVVKSELATFFEAFPNGSAWTNHGASAADPGTKLGYDLVLLGPTGAALPHSDLNERLARPDHELVRASLDDVELTRPSPAALIDHYIARASDLAPWLAGAQVNRDRNLRLQYLAGMGLDARNERALLDSLLAYRR